ncbi:hypothetical protein G7046_g9324 [Stylonectria norvegica]|nr:hypothetical protein G7046_g9324 [Stylonectria norvegica]
MDLANSRQRSASHGSLHSTYRSHGPHGRSNNYTLPRPPSQRRPLRSVKENSNLLRSPGPLESMLKTTTETGDIGIFSIRPAPPSVTYHYPPRPRPHFGDASLLKRPHSRGTDDGYFHDDRKRLPSYRDTTSEIISLSRKIPSHKSSCTLQSQSSVGGLQRPRSPFPYPTRLKRPGVRPASPAVTENGGVDYSKMVELDRVSFRTIHGPYKPMNFQGQRRYPPLSLRPERNRSTSSLPSRASPGPYYHVSMPNRVRTPNSTVSWTPKPSGRHDRESTDQSVRSASLTSIVEMYQSPMNISRTAPPLRPTGSFYYDYTEQFETEAPPEFELVTPLCPIPQRAGSISRPMVLREDSEVHLDAADDEPILEVGAYEHSPMEDDAPEPAKENEAQPRELDRLSHPLSTPGSGSGFVTADGSLHTDNRSPSSSVIETNETEKSQRRARREISSSAPPPEARGTELEINPDMTQRPASTSNSLKSSPGSIKYQPPQDFETETDAVSCFNKRTSHPSFARLRFTLDPAISGLTTLVPTFDKFKKTSFHNKAGETVVSNVVVIHNEIGEVERQKSATHPRLQKRLSRTKPTESEPDSTSFHRRHRRNLATTRIGAYHSEGSDSTTAKDEAHEPPGSLSHDDYLAMDNCKAQLMKALPPLPDDAERTEGYVMDSSSTDGEGLTQLLFTSPAKAPASPLCEIDGNSSTTKPPVQIDSSSTTCQPSPLKLRIRLKRSRSAGYRTELSPDPIETCEGKPSSGIKQKLKLKVSRRQLGEEYGVPSGTIVRSAGFKQLSSLTEVGKSPESNLPEKVLNTKSSNPAPDSLEYVGHHLSPQPSDQFDIPYPPSPRRLGGANGESNTAINAVFNDAQGMNPSMSLVGYRGGLRQKLSLLRLRSTSVARSKNKRSGEPSSHFRNHRMPMSPNMIFDGVVTKRRAAIHKEGRAASARSAKKEGRVKRWAVEAKRAVRSCVRRTLDRSSSSGA